MNIDLEIEKLFVCFRYRELLNRAFHHFLTSQLLVPNTPLWTRETNSFLSIVKDEIFVFESIHSSVYYDRDFLTPFGQAFELSKSKISSERGIMSEKSLSRLGREHSHREFVQFFESCLYDQCFITWNPNSVMGLYDE